LLVSRPRLLFVSPRFLFPLDEGGKIRTVGILRAMQGGAFDVTLVSPAPPDVARFRPELKSVAERFISWPQRTPGLLERALGVLGHLPVSTASDQSATGRTVVQEQLAVGTDVLVADFPHSAVLLPTAMGAASVMFTHNVEAEILERHAAQAQGWRRAVWQREARKMLAFEAATLQAFTEVVAVSERDARALASRYNLGHVSRIDTGVDLDYYPYTAPRSALGAPPGTPGTVVFAGAMDSRSNIDGIEFLLRDIWPLVLARRPATRMKIVGRNPPPGLVAEAARTQGWSFTGFVDDTRPHLREGDISAIPLRVGSGTRLKAFEAMAMGLPVVSTTLGVEGLGLEPGHDYAAADTAGAFADAIVRLLNDPASRQRLAESGRALLEARYSWKVIGRQFEAICLETRTRFQSNAK
jgi:glycosyltransferase involved in cell wall biosynthesis